MTFQSAAATMLAAASFVLPADAGAQTIPYTYNGFASAIFRNTAGIISK